MSGARKEPVMTDNKPTVKVKLVRSVAGTRESHRATVRGLGLHKLNSESTLEVGHLSCRNFICKMLVIFVICHQT